MMSDWFPEAAAMRAKIRDRVAITPGPLPTPCWVWTLKLANGGYASTYDLRLKRTRSVHVLSYEAHVGPLPDGLHLDHLCRVRACCNPEHLEPVTKRENIRRGVRNQNTAKTHCPAGHPYDEVNTGYNRNRPGVAVGPRAFRYCKTCRREGRRRRATRSTE